MNLPEHVTVTVVDHALCSCVNLKSARACNLPVSEEFCGSLIMYVSL